METKSIDKVEIDICTGCAGIFLDDGEFESFTGVDPGTGLIRLSRFASVLAKLNEKAMLDELTGVYNRKYFNEVMKNVFENKNRSPLSLIAIDIDNFKTINTNHGHDGGDKILKDTASIMKSLLRPSRDDYIFRLGGEEFAILLFNLNVDDSYHTADGIRRMVELTPIQVPAGGTVNITISLGVALARPVDDPDSFYKRSDELLYKAKNTGKNRVVMDS